MGRQRREREEHLPKSWNPQSSNREPFGSSIRLLKERGLLPPPPVPSFSHLKTPWGSPHVQKGPLPTHKVSLGLWRQLAHTCSPCWLCYRVSKSQSKSWVKLMGCEENHDLPCIFLTRKLCWVNTGFLIPSKKYDLSHFSWDKSLSFYLL